MSLIAIIGKMGDGKTATLTFLAKHFFNQGNNIFSNYILKDINHKYVLSMNDIDNVKFGKAFYDEFWLWLDSRSSSFDEYNKKISDILLKSRKRGYDIYYTLQGFYQIDKRIRNVTDYILMPEAYVYKNCELSKVEQNFLYPIDMKQFLNDIVIYVDVCIPVGENELKKVDDFSFWLRDVANSYDTSEEIQDIKNPLQKGIYHEGIFITFIKEYLKDMGLIITQSPNSGHYINSLDIEIQSKEHLYLIDVGSLENKKINGYEYFYIDMRKKDLDKILKIAEMRKAYPLISYKFNNEWFLLFLDNQKVQEIMRHKDNVNIKHIKEYIITLEKFKDVIK